MSIDEYHTVIPLREYHTVSPLIASPEQGWTRASEAPEETNPRHDDFEAARFALKEGPDGLSQWFPQVQEDSSSKRFRIWSSRRSHALLLQIILILVIFITNLSFTLFTVSRYGSNEGVGLIYEGDCATVGDLNLWIHLLINVLSTGMLTASNFCMQLLAAPTRADIDRVHGQGKWMDIGVPSLHNLWHISIWRRFTWALLALSSLPIHFL